MSESLDITTILFLVLAVVIFLRLRNVLGRRTGHERPPYEPYSRREARQEGPTPQNGQDTVVALPRREGAPGGRPTTQDLEKRFEKIAPKGSPLAAGLAEIAKNDPSFEPEHFLAGAKSAYEMIVTAFAGGNTKALRQLLSRDVYDGFVAAIGEREARDEKVDSNFVGIDKADIIEAELKGKIAHVTIRFVSELITATYDRDGELIDGDPKRVREVTDIWTFARDTASRDPNWKLVATEAEN